MLVADDEYLRGMECPVQWMKTLLRFIPTVPPFDAAEQIF
ncbi:hypothetical protein BN1079_00334 [Pseudomonas saudiphocaensis]|uniref:Uncharacterized protein n=1 Tax=Pseudomonas saudiphocaensis TaxID=1499686 RepID=A0A078LPN8_9PSED|nr:hypothetical protein BN1079_00334 [Pseudomonas saudiphocaensis]